MKKHQYECSKCGNRTFEQGEIHTTGGFWSKIFDVQHMKFTTIVCSHCRYTEIYQADTKTLGNIFDFMTQ